MLRGKSQRLFVSTELGLFLFGSLVDDSLSSLAVVWTYSIVTNNLLTVRPYARVVMEEFHRKMWPITSRLSRLLMVIGTDTNRSADFLLVIDQ